MTGRGSRQRGGVGSTSWVECLLPGTAKTRAIVVATTTAPMIATRPHPPSARKRGSLEGR